MKDECFLLIAGFHIKLNFYEGQWSFARNKLINDIKDTYKGFFEQKPKKPKFIIDFHEIIALDTISQGSQLYVNLYRLKGNRLITCYQIGIIQFQLILREILSLLLAKNNGFLLHGSAVAKNNQAILFLGNNGAGKSTAMTLASPIFKALADDTVIIRYQNKAFYLYQTPFMEKNDWVEKSNKKYFLKEAYFLVKSRNFKKVPIIRKDYLIKKIIRQFWTSQSESTKQISLIMTLVNKFNRFYYLFFAINKKKFIELIS